MGIVVNNLEESLKKWTEIYQAGPWKIMTHSSRYLRDVYAEETVVDKEWEFRVALSMMGGNQLELIEPAYGVPIYQDFLKKNGEGIHHFKEIMPDDEMEERIKQYQEQGIKILFGGDFFGAKFYYPETIPLLGVQIEIGNGAVAQLPPDYDQVAYYP